MEFLAFKLLLTLAFFIGFPLVMVMLPIMVICEVAKANQKKRQQEIGGTSVSPSAMPGVAVSQEDGRVIAMEAPDPQPVTPADVKPQKPGFNLVKDGLVPVAGKVAAVLVMHAINHRPHRK